MTTLVTGVPVVQFRSDTERGTLSTNRLRRGVDSSREQGIGPFGPSETTSTSLINVDGGLPVSELDTSRTVNIPTDLRVGWKISPDDAGSERFWAGDRWTDITRPLENE